MIAHPHFRALPFLTASETDPRTLARSTTLDVVDMSML